MAAATSLEQECDAWAARSSMHGGNDMDKGLARQVAETLQPLLTDSRFSASRIDDEDWLLELVEAMQAACEDVFALRDARGNAAYDATAARHLLTLMHGHLHTNLQACVLRALARWERAAASLLHMHNSTIPTPTHNNNLTSLHARITDILHMREAHEELARLLDTREVDAHALFAPLRSIDVFACDSGVWTRARREYEANIAPLERRVAVKLQSLLAGSLLPMLAATMGGGRKADGAHVFRELHQRRELLKRPVIASSLSGERAQLARAALSYVHALRARFEQGAETHQHSITACAHCCRQTLQGCKSTLPLISLDATGKLMDIDVNDGHVRVNFSDELIDLLRDAQQLTAMGYVVPEKVANFYNDIGSQMLPCQKSLMLSDAVSFESVLTRPVDATGKPIAWGSKGALEGYVGRLQTVARGLVEKNRRLRGVHDELGRKVCVLIGTDLVSKREKWKDGVKELRAVFDDLERKGLQNTREWRLHWDHQLYKALLFQYRAGLDRLHESLPIQEIKMIYRSRRLQFDPPLEDLRANHYKEMARYIAIPLNFKGVMEDGSSNIFECIMRDAECMDAVAACYERAEEKFMRLVEEQKKLAEWVLLGAVEEGESSIEEFVDKSLKDAGDYEMNFKVLKAKAKALEKIPPSVSVPPYVVSLSPVRSAAEDLLRRLQSALAASLARGAAVDRAAVQEWLAKGRAALEATANSVEEIGEARKTAMELVGGVPDMLAMRRRCEEKNKLLRTVGLASASAAAASASDLSKLATEWENFTIKLEKHEAHLNEQKDRLKGMVESRVEEVGARISAFASKWRDMKPSDTLSTDSNKNNAMLVLARLQDYANMASDLAAEAANISRDCAHFSMPQPDFPTLHATQEDINASALAWGRYGAFAQAQSELLCRDWLSVRVDTRGVEEFVAKWQKEAAGALKIDSKDGAGTMIVKEVEKMKRVVPCLGFIRGEGWQRTHWAQLFAIMQLPSRGPDEVRAETLTLAHIVSKSDVLVSNLDALKHLHAQAQGEVVMRESLQQLIVWGVERKFTLMKYEHEHVGKKDSTTYLIKEWKEVLAEIGDHQSLIQSLKDSPFHGAFKDDTGVWERRLNMLAEGLGSLQSIQRKWVYLEPLFARGALPHERPRFARADEDFRSIMGAIARDSTVAAFADMPRLKDVLPAIAAQLDICQRALQDYLEEKRDSFARFYFIGDDDLLEILGQSSRPSIIQSHLSKLFAGIRTVVFDATGESIIAVKSAEGEAVKLKREVRVGVGRSVEEWMGELAGGVREALREALGRALEVADLDAFPSQVLCLAEQVHFTRRCEAALASSKSNKNSLHDLCSELQAQLKQLTALDPSSTPRGTLLKARALVLDVIHELDVVEGLSKVAKEGSEGIGCEAWDWQRQLRFYCEDDKGGDVSVRMAQATQPYSWEYQGNAPKLVYTPLSDTCFLTLMQGLASGCGGNPYGPAGTGKTESVKALGQYLGRQVLVFNCDESFDPSSLGRIFAGLLRAGAWGCFDEFNRLDEEVLSAVSQQIQSIQTALKEGLKTLDFMGKSVDVCNTAGVFVTLNPAGKGYGGRSKLPDNLKSLFRSVAMTAPDNELIAEVHYDWGLRALKTVLAVAGTLKTSHSSSNPTPTQPTTSEPALLVRALRVTTLPKLAYGDVGRFNALVADVFPDVGVGVGDDGESDNLTRVGVEEAARSLGLGIVQAQIDKVMQLNTACRQRIGVMLVGPAASGKTTLWRILEAALRRLPGRQHMRVHIINPKALPRRQLLGHMDLDTREWFDGVLTASSRQAWPDVHSWIVCDGDVDPEWIESLNSVLDDNRLLTLPSGERFAFGNNVNFIFECHDLKFASPATVSRTGCMRVCTSLMIPPAMPGMLFLSEENLDLRTLLQSFIDRQPVSSHPHLSSHFTSIFTPALDYVLKTRKLATDTPWVGAVKGFLTHLSNSLTDPNSNTSNTKLTFTRCLLRSLGGNMKPEDRKEFEKELGKVSGESVQGIGDVGDVAAGMGRGREGEEGEGIVATETCQQACFKLLERTAVATIHCNAQTTAAHIIQKLTQVCGAPVSTTGGRILKPRDSERVILHLEDLNLPKPDKYDTSQVVSFLQQLITYRGFYDLNSLEWIGVDHRIVIVGSINPASTVGRHNLSPRLVGLMRVAQAATPARGELEQGADKCARVAACMVDMYEGVQKAFSQDEQRHYQFTPRHITEWVEGLSRYSLDSPSLFPSALRHECARVFRDRLAGPDSRARFDAIAADKLATIGSVDGEEEEGVWVTDAWRGEGEGGGGNGGLGGEKVRFVELGEFKALVNEQVQSYAREHQQLDLLLFPEMLHSLARFDRVLSRPVCGSLLLCGSPGAGRRALTAVAAHARGAEVWRPRVGRGWDLKDHHLAADHAIVEAVNGLLGGGEVAGCWGEEEMGNVMAPLQDRFATEGFRHRTLYSFFLSRVRSNLHVVLILDPRDPLFASRLEANPALLQACSVQWMEGWSEGVTNATSREMLREEFDKDEGDRDEKVPEYMAEVHKECVEKMGATPRQYLNFVELYKRIFGLHRSRLLSHRSHLSLGLSKLSDASSRVDDLSRAAETQRRALGEKRGQAEQALDMITTRMQRAGESKKEAEVLSKQLAEEELTLNERKKAIEESLLGVQPLLDASRREVGQIRSDHLAEIRSLKMPPDAIRDVLEGVLRLMGNYDTSWNSMKKFLGAKSVKDEIMSFDARGVGKEARASVQQLLVAKASSFEPATITRVSVAAAPLAAWVKANVRYAAVLESVEPLERDYRELTERLGTSKERLMACQKDISGLDEEERWAAQVSTLSTELKSLPLHSLLAAAFIAYLSPLSESSRQSSLSTWQKMLGVSNFSLSTFLATESELLTWRAAGLPASDTAADNAASVSHAHTCTVPMLIDPAEEAAPWLMSYLRSVSGRVVESVVAHDPRFVTLLELAVRFGKTLVVTEVDGIEPMLYPLLRREVVMAHGAAGRAVVQPIIPPSASSYLTLLDFSTTPPALEARLLTATVAARHPEAERRRQEAVKEGEGMRMRVAELEKQLLEASLDKQREAYRPAARLGSTLFFLLKDLAAMDHMYRWSLNVFLGLYGEVLKGRGGEEEDDKSSVEANIAAISAALVKSVFQHAARSVFKADRLTLAMHMAQALQAGKVSPLERESLLGTAPIDASASAAVPQWVPREDERACANYVRVASTLPQLVADMDLKPETQFPKSADSPKTAFAKLLIIQALRPDRLESAMSQYASWALGLASGNNNNNSKLVGGIAPPPLSLASVCVNEGSNTTPILFITSAGADPSQELQDFAARQIYALQPHADFRLLLTSASHPSFPLTLLERSLKVTYEAPPGVKRSVQRTYDAWQPEVISSGTNFRAQLLFALAWTHAILLERRNFIPQGWTKFYEFSFADLRAGVDIINTSTAGGKVPDWESLRGLLERARKGQWPGLAGSIQFAVPPNARHADYITAIQALPDDNSPELFGLPANTERTAQQANASAVLAKLKTLLVSRSVTEGVFEREAWSQRLAPVLKQWEKLLAANPQLKAKDDRPPAKPTNPIDAFVYSQRVHGFKVMQVIGKSLNGLARVLRGVDTLTPTMHKQGMELLRMEVPAAWESVWEGAGGNNKRKDPLAYMLGAVARLVAADAWAESARQGTLLAPGTHLAVGQAYHPGRFISALRQHCARALKTPMDQLTFLTCWDPARAPGCSVAVSGMQIQGALFDGQNISDCNPDTPSFTPVPVVRVAWVRPAARENNNSSGDALMCPIYVSTDRSQLLAEAQLPCVRSDPAKWTRASIALVLCVD
eukprot:jgi/Chlat1/2494/Chrsp175S08714